MGRPSGREDLRSGNVSADVMRVMRRERWRAWWARQMTVRDFNVSDPIRRLAWPAAYFALVLLLFPVGTAYREFTGIFERAEHRFEWAEPVAYETAPADDALRRRVRRVVHSVLMEIGHDVTVSSVDVADVGGLAYYRPFDNTIIFSNRLRWNDDDELLHSAAHEATHALWAKLLAKHEVDTGYESLINEMTAYILGAHLAGRVRTREGGDGDALRTEMVEWYRASCDDSDPRCARSSVTERWVFMRGNTMSPNYYEHWGSVQMVDEIDAICRRHSYSAWDAAQAIADRYLTTRSTTNANSPPSASSQVEW